MECTKRLIVFWKMGSWHHSLWGMSTSVVSRNTSSIFDSRSAWLILLTWLWNISRMRCLVMEAMFRRGLYASRSLLNLFSMKCDAAEIANVSLKKYRTIVKMFTRRLRCSMSWLYSRSIIQLRLCWLMKLFDMRNDVTFISMHRWAWSFCSIVPLRNSPSSIEVHSVVTVRWSPWKPMLNLTSGSFRPSFWSSDSCPSVILSGWARKKGRYKERNSSDSSRGCFWCRKIR